MTKLPLFPLNTVLFPGTPLPLHIFEERYKLMIKRCVEAGQPFGAVLIKSGAEVLGMGRTAEPYTIGCLAKITQVEPFGDGRVNIVAVGLERFRILSLEHDQPYLVGEVEPFPINRLQPEIIRSSGRLLRPWVERYVGMLDQAEKAQFELKRLPRDSVALAYLAAALLKTPPPQKQELLTVSDAVDLIERIHELYHKEVTLLKMMMRRPQNPHESPFSLN